MKRPIPWYIAIGASGSDGLDDIRKLLSLLEEPLRATVLVVLHRPWEKPTNLASILRRSCPHPVRIASENEHLEPGCVYIGEPAEHLTLIGSNLGKIIVDPTKLHRNRTVDLLFKSVAEHGREHMIGVVLSGSLDDGSRGLAAIHHAGGLTMVLLPSRAGQIDMRNNAIEFDGPIDVIGSVLDIATAIESAIGIEIEGLEDLAPTDR
jgi:two-component system, chemotaxis family, protein-glutamate methylesterase/glutaminase